MVSSVETVGLATSTAEPNTSSSSPRISFSAEFLDDKNFISICPNSNRQSSERNKEEARNPEFEFLSGGKANNMITADELFCEGKLLPFWQIQQSEKLNKISLSSNNEEANKEPKVSWFIDEDPSPRPPNCTVLWKELLRLKKKRVSSLSPSSSSSSTSSSSSSLADIAIKEEKKEGCSSGKRGEKHHVKRIKKGLERSRSGSITIRPMVNVPICAQVKTTTTNSLPPLFPLKKGRPNRFS